MQSKLSRRGVVAGVAVAPLLPAALMQTKADTELAALGEQFTDVVKRLGENAWNDEALLARLAALGTAIMDTQATTIEGLIVKARIACFVQGSGIWFLIDPKHQQPGFPFAMSIVADLVRRYDPDLEWTSDLVPSAERARLARAIRDGNRGA